ncbi:MAG: DUF885 domain-containing protein [Candidatus Heimdallarchaeota archaeon]|nr:DUF885 domain-containing protein [Candidatus Heimdallarchaeota archaeon]
MYEDIIDRWKQFHPLDCHGLGIHEFDGEIPDYSLQGIAKRIEEIKSDLNVLRSLEEPIDKIERYEYNLLISTLEIELYDLDINKEYLKSPIPYVFSWFNPLSIIENSFTMRSYDTINNRVKSITKLENNIPRFIEVAINNLQGKSMSKVKIKSALEFLEGNLAYYKDDLISFITQIEEESLIQEWSLANEKTIEAMEQFIDFLKESIKEAHDEFALGEEEFIEMLSKTEGMDATLLSADYLLKIGEADLNRNFSLLQQIADAKTNGNIKELLKEIEMDYPAPEDLLSYTEMTLERTKRYVMESDLVSVPVDNQCKAIYTPKSMRNFAFAAMDTPGAFEKPEASEAYYWVTPPEPTWSEEKTSSYMTQFNKSAFESITIHEAWPGHYLQLLYNNTAESTIAKMFAYSYAMIEGWAHYTEEMIIESGYAPFDQDNLRVGQLLEALVRNVRFVVAVRMHCREMSIEEATEMFITKAFLNPFSAQLEAKRGTIDPMYLNYTLGKLMIKKLLEDYKKEKGDEFDLKSFHNELLSFGSPPISVLRTMMLENPKSEIL